MSEALEELAARAVKGDRDALDRVVAALRDDVFGLSMRMLAHPADAEDQTQEILVRIVTNLGTFQGESALRTWAFRVASNHLVSCAKSRYERFVSSFDDIDRVIEQGESIAPVALSEADATLLADEVKLGCLHAILLALDRDERMAYALGEVFGLTSDEAAEVVATTPAAFRKRLSRAREKLSRYMGKTCGLISQAARCSCRRQIPVHLKHDFIKPERLLYLAQRTRSRREAPRQPPAEVLEAFAHSEKVAEAFRSQPDYAAPQAVVDRIRDVIDRGTLDFLS
jgi:RNA polymerase sigma factor (sigma-70 family)